MGAPSSPGRVTPRTASHSISFYLTAGLIVPVTCVLVLWGLVAGLVLDGKLDRLHWLSTTSPGHQTVIGATVIVGAGLIVVVIVVMRLAWFVRRLAEEISSLTATAGDLAGEQLPRIVAALRNGEEVTAGASAQPSGPAMKITEIAAAAAAINGLYRAAVAATVAEAGLRDGFRQILVSLGRRNQSLLHRQLRIIDGLEQQASNPSALADLFTLDHLTTRMRRHAESLTILSGAAAGRTWSGPVPVIDVMRAATAEVEDYTRVTVITDADEAVTAQAVTDMIHLLAELIENATLFSPSTTRVEVRAERVANGFAIEIEDRGLGIPSDQLAEINARLASPPDFDVADVDRLGLFVAGRLAARHGVHIALAPSAYRGTKAVVVLPDSIVVMPAEPGAAAGSAGLVTGRTARLNLRAPEVLSLAGAIVPASPAAEEDGDTEPGSDAVDNALVDAALVDAALIDADAHVDVLASTTIHGLPRRIRPDAAAGASSGPRDGGQRPADEPDELPRRHVPPEGPAPDHARTLAASLQNSWQRSRRDDKTPDSAPESEEF
jgi:signal transduction histidine kinase